MNDTPRVRLGITQLFKLDARKNIVVVVVIAAQELRNTTDATEEPLNILLAVMSDAMLNLTSPVSRYVP